MARNKPRVLKEVSTWAIRSFKVPSSGEMGSKQELSGSGGVSIGVVVSQCQRGTFVAVDNVSIQHHFRIQFHTTLLVGVVSQLLLELPRTLKGQNGVEFNFQSI